MTQKTLKKLNRKQLLDLLLEQAEQIERLTLQVKGLEAQLEDRRLTEARAGTLAAAALELNGVFAAADAAAAQYLENVKRIAAEQAGLTGSDSDIELLLAELEAEEDT